MEKGEYVRQPIVVVLGHVDHGKTTLLDKIRGSAVALKEPGQITQEIGATFIPLEVIEKICGPLIDMFKIKIKIPGILVIDTPGHEAFSNLRVRGGSVADIAILVIDVMSGFQPQTIESLQILKDRKVPFLVAANKIDLIPGWESVEGGMFLESVKRQSSSAVNFLERKIYELISSFMEHGFMAERFDRVKNFRTTVAIVPVSAKTGEGIPELLAVLVGLVQAFMMDKLKTSYKEAKGVVLEVKEEVGLGKTMDTIIYDGVLRKNDLIVVGGLKGPVVTTVRALLLPKPLDEIRKPRYRFDHVEEVHAAAGVKIVAPDIEDVVAGSPLRVVGKQSLEEVVREVAEEVEALRIKSDKIGVVVKANSLGGLEALVAQLKRENVPIRIADVGDIAKRDVIEALVVKEKDDRYAVILGFNVKMLPDAEEEAKEHKIPVFLDQVIYRLIERYEKWKFELEESRKKLKFETLIRPGKVKFLPGFVFRRSKPAIIGVEVLAGVIKPGYPLIREDGKKVGRIQQIQHMGKPLKQAVAGQKVAVSIMGPMVGRHIKEGDILYVDSPVEHLEALKNEFADRVGEDELKLADEVLALKRKVRV